jgi:hypothetical protein
MRLSIVQLSDIHFCAAQNSVESRVAQLAAAICSTDPICTEYVVFLTGDVAQSGQEDEYTIAVEFLKTLSAEMRKFRTGSKVQFLSIPGNHDCHLPQEEIQLREALVQAIHTTLQEEPNPSILRTLLKSQEPYFKFFQGTTSLPIDNQLCSSHIIPFDTHRIQFNLYNTALLSERNEKQGALSLPMKIVKSVVSLREDCALSISAFHHPYTWLEANVGLEFRTHVERTSDVALTGHQHYDHGFSKDALTGERLFYSEGDVLQEPNRADQSGFRVMIFDLVLATRRIVSYRWASFRYTAQDDSSWMPYTRTNRLEHISPTKEFLSSLSDSGIGLIHPVTGPISLETVFVYPDVVTRKLAAPETTKEMPGTKLLQHLTDSHRLIIQGEPSSGKTALARTVAVSWLRDRLFYPILIEGKIVKRADQAFLERICYGEARKAYGDESLERYKQLAPSSKVLIIDNWDDSPMGIEQRESFLARAEAYFGKVILLVDGISYLQGLLAKINGTEAILQYDHITIHGMSHVARGQLIERWINQDLARETSEFTRRVEETERLVNNVIGKNTLPSLPFIVLSILQALEHKKHVLPENGSFGYLYEVLITTALSATICGKSQLEKKYAFLSLLAYRLFDTSMEVMSESSVNELLGEYAESLMVKVDGPALLADLDYAHVLTQRDGNYGFVYPHFLQYFLARYFKDNLHGKTGPALRKRLKEIVAGLNVEANRTFLMFVIYLTNDDGLTDELVALGQDILSDFAPSDLTTEVDFYNNEADPRRERAIPESVDLEQSRLHRRELADENQRRPVSENNTGSVLPIPGEAFSNLMPLDLKLDYARSCLQILGQVLKNFAGTLPGPQKLLILNTTYLLGLRILRALLESVKDSSTKVRNALAITKQEKPEFAPLAKKVEFLLTMMAQIVGVSIIRLISLSVGSTDIEGRAYSITLEEIGRNNATQLVDLSIKLDHFESYPLKEIKTLKSDYSQNRFAYRILRELVIDQMHVFKMDREMRQRVLSLLSAEPSNPLGLLRGGNKRFKDEGAGD